jgi:hypothetical protein
MFWVIITEKGAKFWWLMTTLVCVSAAVSGVVSGLGRFLLALEGELPLIGVFGFA